MLFRSSFDIIYCFFFNDTATTEIYTLSLHDALPICEKGDPIGLIGVIGQVTFRSFGWGRGIAVGTANIDPLSSTQDNISHPTQAYTLGLGNFSTRSEEHTSELQSH